MGNHSESLSTIWVDTFVPSHDTTDVPQSLAAIYPHIVYSTKNRDPLIPSEAEAHLAAYLAGAGERHGCPSLGVGVVTDHVHLLLRQSRTITVADLVKELKTTSSAWMKQHRRDFAWQGGYAAFSFGRSEVAALQTYVRHQSEHHRKLGFQEELRALCVEHDIEWDERYVWD